MNDQTNLDFFRHCALNSRVESDYSHFEKNRNQITLNTGIFSKIAKFTHNLFRNVRKPSHSRCCSRRVILVLTKVEPIHISDL